MIFLKNKKAAALSVGDTRESFHRPLPLTTTIVPEKYVGSCVISITPGLSVETEMLTVTGKPVNIFLAPLPDGSCLLRLNVNEREKFE